MSAEICGLAVPINFAEKVGNNLEFIAPGAFDSFLASWRRPIPLLHQSHTGPIVGRVVEMFCDASALWFRAEIFGPHVTNVRYGMTRLSENSCSIQMSGMTTDRVRADGVTYQAVTKAGIEHVALVHSPCYRATAAWPAVVNGPMPARLARVAGRFNLAYVEHQAAQRRARVRAEIAAARAAKRARKPEPPRRPASLAALLADKARRDAFNGFRETVAASIASGFRGSVVLGHAAFSRAANFDRKQFERQISAAAARPHAMRSIW